MPIPEALAELSRNGLIEMAANNYTRVAKPTSDAPLDTCQAQESFVRLSVSSRLACSGAG